jgi:hypothetical protein
MSSPQPPYGGYPPQQPPYGGSQPPGGYGWQWQPQPPQYQPPAPRPPRHSARNGCLWVAGGLLALIMFGAVIGAVTGGSNSTSGGSGTAPAAAPAATTEAPPAPTFGQAALDGDFAFVVERESCGARAAAAVNAGGIGETVPGGAVECIFTIKITDDKGVAQTFFDSNQYAYDAAGKQYSADTNASVFLQGDQDNTQVNPGISIIAKLPFQIPAGDRITQLQLHDSMFSGGVTVRV